jgi:hypothetical protein
MWVRGCPAGLAYSTQHPIPHLISGRRLGWYDRNEWRVVEDAFSSFGDLWMQLKHPTAFRARSLGFVFLSPDALNA